MYVVNAAQYCHSSVNCFTLTVQNSSRYHCVYVCVYDVREYFHTHRHKHTFGLALVRLPVCMSDNRVIIRTDDCLFIIQSNENSRANIIAPIHCLWASVHSHIARQSAFDVCLCYYESDREPTVPSPLLLS